MPWLAYNDTTVAVTTGIKMAVNKYNLPRICPYKMVRRIIPDSDFESDDDVPTCVAPDVIEDKPLSTTAPSSSNGTPPAPQSTRRIVRHKDLHAEPVGTYTYDSDIYTEESSIGSFIVYTDDENDEHMVGEDSSTVNKEF
jgi:hypothetical protein